MNRALHTKNKIITSSTELFNTKGYRATSLSDITKATSLTKGAIYGHFLNKDEMAVASFEHATEKIISLLRTTIKEAPTAPLKLKAVIIHYMKYVLDPPIKGGCPIINTSVEADDNFPLLQVRVISTIGIIKDSIKKIIQRGIREKQISLDVDVDGFAMKYYSAILGAVLIARIENRIDMYETVMDQLIKEIDTITI